MKERKEVEEVEEVNEVKEKCGGIAAFFDLDGTLVAGPSLERRFFRRLRYRQAIPAKNYFLWLREAVRIAPRGFRAIRYANKMYLRRVPLGELERQANEILFFAEAMDRVAWHAKQRHKIVIVSGTLEPLAREAAMGLESELEARGIAAEIDVCATRLEESAGRWTGRVVGVAMYGESKVHAVQRMAKEKRLDLTKCYAYGDSTMDRWLLAAVGRPVAVNASKGLLRIAQGRNWPVLFWEKREEEESTQSSQKAQRSQGKSGKKEVAGSESEG
jgi:HAD superfamily hydrolase (TIGR01490 family)